MAEQTAQIALKAFLYGTGRRQVWIHSVAKLAQECAEADPAFQECVDPGKILDKYYLSPRYPDALPPPSVPFESFTGSEAVKALEYARAIVALVASRLRRAHRPESGG